MSVLNELQEWWREAVGGTVLASVLSWIGYQVKSVHKLEKGKADKSDILTLVDRLDNSHKVLMDRIDKSNDDAREARRAIYQKIDDGFTRQDQFNRRQEDFNLRVAQHMGVQIGRQEGG